MIVTILVFLLILSILVLIHEAGHYFVAKKLGVKVDEFGFGFPPRIFGKKIGETIYSLNLLPIGGFVKLYGEDEAGGGKLRIKNQEVSIKNDKRSFISRNPWQRAAIVVAGVVMNFLLAVVVLSYLFAVVGVPTPGNEVVIAGIAKNSPADKAGLVTGDIVLTLDNKPLHSPQELITATKQHMGEPVILRIKNPASQRGEKELRIREVTLVPRKTYPKNEGSMGVVIAPSVVVKKYPWYQAPIVGTGETLKQSWMILQGLGTIIYQLIFSRSVPEGLAGPVGIAQLTGQVVQVGFDAVLSLVALLSLNLAVMNVLPIPALDGGRLFFILIEAVTGRKVSQKFEGYAHAIGMAVLLTLIALITFHDIFRIFTHQPLLPK